MTALGVVLVALGLSGAFVGRSPLGALNFVVLQWFGVRLVAVTRVVPRYGDKSGPPHWITHERKRIGWFITRWVWPLTGWWSPYRWIARRQSTVGEMFPRVQRSRLGLLNRVNKQLRRLNRRLRVIARLHPIERCPAFCWQYRCQHDAGHAGEHRTSGDDGTEYRWPR